MPKLWVCILYVKFISTSACVEVVCDSPSRLTIINPGWIIRNVWTLIVRRWDVSIQSEWVQCAKLKNPQSRRIVTAIFMHILLSVWFIISPRDKRCFMHVIRSSWLMVSRSHGTSPEHRKTKAGVTQPELNQQGTCTIGPRYVYVRL